MKKYLDVLKRCPLFKEINEENLLTMLKCLDAKVISFDKKYTIFQDGKPAKYLGIVLSGSAQLIQIDYYGNRNIIAEMTETELFCEAFACAGVKELPLSVIANEPCEIMLICAEHILHTCSNNCIFHQQLIFNLMQNLANKNIQFYQKMEITSKRSTRDKLLAYLMIESQKNGSTDFEIPFDRQELADYLQVDRSGLSAEIGKLRKEGIIKNNKNYFELL